MSKSNLGKENAKKVLNRKEGRWYVYWFDAQGKRHNEPYARWYWETTNGEIPIGYRASYKDENQLNINPENIVLLSPEEFGKRISNRLEGHILSEETKQKISQAHAGKVLTEEHKKHIGEQTKRMWKDGIFDNPKVREAYSQQGKSTKGSKRTEEQRKKMSDARKNMDISQLFTPEAKAKRIKTISGRTQSIQSNQKRSKKLKNRSFTDEHLKKLSESGKKRIDNKRENSHWWKGGIANRPYPEEFNPYLKRRIRRRDQYICQSCGENVYRSPRGHVHHIDGNKQNCAKDNLVLLCATCHNAVHGRNSITGERIEYYKSLLI